MLERLRTALRGTRAYDVWSALRGEQQRRAYVRLLDEVLLDSRRAVNAPTASLAELRGRRRALLGADGRPHVVAFGSEQWEQYGLWPAFAELGRFYLSHYGDEHAPPPRSPETEEAMRERRARGFLAAVDEAESHAPVTCVFFYASGQHVSDALLAQLAQRGIWTVMMGLDDKQQLVRPHDGATNQSHQLRVARQVNLYWTTFRAGLPLITASGGRPWYQPEGAHPKFHAARAGEPDLDIVFVGQAYGYRRALVDYLRARGFKVEARGRGWAGGPVTFEESIALYNRAKVVLGIGGVGHMRAIAHLKGRDFEVPMCGALYLTSFNPELADFYVIGREILCYSSFEDCAETLAWVLREPAAADLIRREGHERAQRDHDWRKRLRNIFWHPRQRRSMIGRLLHSRRLKRAADVALAATGLAVAAPVMAVTAAAIRATMGLPVLFEQERPGLHGSIFKLRKFRTMRVAVTRNEADAARLTRLGTLLRMLSIDELPALWNVLRGEMSIVGPRPLLVRYLPRYTAEQRRRHEVLPGLTGLAQVRGRNALSWDEKFALDLWYVDHWSLMLDARIVLETAWNVVTRRGINAPGHATMPEFMGSDDA